MPGRGRPRVVQQMRCSRHPAGHVVAYGSRQLASGPHRRYRCTQPSGEMHVFDVPLDDDGQPVVRSWSPPPVCPDHPGGKVVRNGMYGVRTPVPRQTYRCTPAEDAKPHDFTPALARHHGRSAA